MLNVSLFGSPEVQVDGVAVAVDTRKAIALLAYLAVEGTTSRDALAALFWAESSNERARATLRRTLSSLRSGIGDEALHADRHNISLASAHVDVAEFQGAIQEVSTHDHQPGEVCQECLAPLELAATLYRGDFLEGFSIKGAPDFEEWERGVSEAFRLQVGTVFQRLGMGHASEGDYASSIAAVTRWTELDPLHEPAHRQLMLLHAWSGDRPGAIEAYRAFAGILDRELGVSPLEETTELYDAILDEDLPPAPSQPRRIRAAARPGRKRDDQMLDRAEELSALLAALQPSGDSGRITAISGPSWMGKTRLLDEAVRQLPAGSFVLRSRAFRMEESLPYGVATQLVKSLTTVLEPYRDEVSPWALTVAAALDPRLLDQGESADHAGGELRLYESIHELLTVASSRKPVALIVDDAQWLDPASAQLLGYLGRRIDRTPGLVMIVAIRSGEHPGEPLRDILDRADDSIELRALEAEDLKDHVADIDEASKIIDETGGVPLLVLEELNGGGASPGVERYLDSQLEALDELARQIVSAASVLTGVCDPNLLRETSGRSDDEVVGAVEELVQAGVLREEPDGSNLVFTLDRLESKIYQSTSLVRRRHLHRRAAEALTSRPRSRQDVRLAGAIAAQLRGAGEDANAANWYQLAGELAAAAYANSEALEFYETAIALGAEDVGHIHLGIGELALRSGNYGEATRQLTVASGQASGDTLARIEHRLGECQRLLGRLEVAEEHFSRALELDADPDLMCDWALLHHRRGADSDGLAMAKQALELARQRHDLQSTSRALNILAILDPDPATALNSVDEALALAGDNAAPRMAGLNTKARLLGDIGNGDAAVRLVEEAVTIARETGFRHQEAALRNHLADLHHQAGRTPEAEAALMDAVTLFADVDAGAWEPEVWLLTQW